MRYEAISANDDFSSLDKKLKIYGYPYNCYVQLILTVTLQTVSMKSPWKKHKKIQIDKLKRLKKSTETKFPDILNEVFDISGKSNSKEEKSLNHIFFGYNYFLMELDSLIRILQKEYHRIPIVKRGPKTAAYIVGAALSLIIIDSRGTRWKDVYQLLRWFNKSLKSSPFMKLENSRFFNLRTEHFTYRDLENQSKYFKINYTSYILELKKECFKPESKI